MAVGTGGQTGLTFPASFACSILGISLSGGSRDVIETSLITDAKGAKTFIQNDWYDAGEAAFDIQFDPATGHPLADASGNLVIDWGGQGSGSIWTMAGSFCIGYSPGAQMGEMMLATVTFKLGGSIAIA